MERQKKTYQSQGAPRPHHRGTRYAGGNFIYEIYNAGSRRLNRVSSIELFLLSVLAGAFMCLASLLSLLFISEITTAGVQYLLSGLGFTLGMLLVLLTNSALFTEGNIFAPANFYHTTMTRSCLRLFRFWLITFIGNIIGAFLFAYFVYLTQDYSETFKQNLMNLVYLKLTHAGTSNYKGMGELLLSGMIANWIIALVSFFALASRNLMNQFVITFLVFAFIAASNFQYFPINLGYFSLNAFLVRSISVSDVFFFNLLPVGIGNILGAGLLAAGSLLVLAKKRHENK